MLEKSRPMMKSAKTYIRPLLVLQSVPGTSPTQHFEVAYVCYLLFTIPRFTFLFPYAVLSLGLLYSM